MCLGRKGNGFGEQLAVFAMEGEVKEMGQRRGKSKQAREEIMERVELSEKARKETGPQSP